MKELSVFDIIGPIMIGPSSSHTAGALKIARVAKMLAATKIVKVHFKLFGSFARTYRGHGTDRALLAGILGFDTGDYRVRDSFELATEAGIEYTFEEMDGETDYHPNTVVITITEANGDICTLRGASIGGGEIEIHELNGCNVTFSGKNNAVLIRSKDRPGVIAPIINLLAKHKVNIINLNAYCEERGLTGFTVVEFDGVLSPEVVKEISNQPDVYSATFLKVK